MKELYPILHQTKPEEERATQKKERRKPASRPSFKRKEDKNKNHDKIIVFPEEEIAELQQWLMSSLNMIEKILNLLKKEIQ